MSEGLIELLSKNIIIGSCSRDSLITMIFLSKTNFGYRIKLRFLVVYLENGAKFIS